MARRPATKKNLFFLGGIFFLGGSGKGRGILRPEKKFSAEELTLQKDVPRRLATHGFSSRFAKD